jgi:hypothetical protein
MCGMDDLDQLRERISTSGVPVSEIAVGAGVKPRWLHLFVAGDIPEPGYKKIVAVRQFLDRKTRARAAA